MFLQDYAERVRNGDLVIDFITMEIYQLASNGIMLKGHGTLKIDAFGALLCNFICTNADNAIAEAFGTTYPINDEDKTQNLRLKAVDINGNTWEAEDFSVTVFKIKPPFKCSFFLSELVHRHEQNIPVQQENYLWFESLEPCRIPRNKTNTIVDSIKGQSFNRNQTDIDLENCKVSIIKHDDYTTVYANGTFDVDKLFAALKFYIGFTSGSMFTACVLTTRTGREMVHHIRSINKKINKTIIPQPVDDLLMLSKTEWNDPFHFQLLPNIIQVQKEFPTFFDSSVSQWKRVWQGFNAQQSITALTLTVSIEGLLIDLFIPKLQETGADPIFEKKKEEIIASLKKTEIDTDHLETIISSVKRWGNIHANAALKALNTKGLITANEVQSWKDLRNSSAHPKYSEITLERELKERARLMRCLTLFYRLNLNIYGYTGAHVVYEPSETISSMFPAVKIFDFKRPPSATVTNYE